MEIPRMTQALEKQRRRLLFLAAVKIWAGRGYGPIYYTWTEHRETEIRMCGGWSAPRRSMSGGWEIGIIQAHAIDLGAARPSPLPREAV